MHKSYKNEARFSRWLNVTSPDRLSEKLVAVFDSNRGELGCVNPLQLLPCIYSPLDIPLKLFILYLLLHSSHFVVEHGCETSNLYSLRGRR